jgi:hypothetical protein
MFSTKSGENMSDFLTEILDCPELQTIFQLAFKKASRRWNRAEVF